MFPLIFRARSLFAKAGEYTSLIFRRQRLQRGVKINLQAVALWINGVKGKVLRAPHETPLQFWFYVVPLWVNSETGFGGSWAALSTARI